MKCPYCPAQIAYYGEEHGCSWPEQSSGLPAGPEDFGGSDEGSHYAAPEAWAETWAEIRRWREQARTRDLKNSRTHLLKIWAEHFKQVQDGTKTFELRRNDRNFQVGDTLVLQEWDPLQEKYTGEEVRVSVTSLSNSPEFIREGYVCLSIRKQ